MDQSIKKNVLRKLIYGIYILAVENNHEFSAATVTWLSQASFDPPMLMLGLKKTSKTYQLVNKSKKFSINILNISQKKMASSFFKETILDDDKLNGYEFKITENEIPVFKNVNSNIECEMTKLIETGDHDIIVARIINVQNLSNENVLTLENTGWKYGG